MKKLIFLATLAVLALAIFFALDWKSDPVSPSATESPTSPAISKESQTLAETAEDESVSTRLPLAVEPSVEKSAELPSFYELSGSVRKDPGDQPVASGQVGITFEGVEGNQWLKCAIIDGVYSEKIPHGARLQFAEVSPKDEVEGLAFGRIDEVLMSSFIGMEVELNDLLMDADRKLDLRVLRGASVEGIVIDAVSEEPIEGAFVVVEKGFSDQRAARSNLAGGFVIEGLEFEEWEERTLWKVSATHPRYCAFEREFWTEASTTELHDLRLSLSPGVSVSGRVLDANGKGCPRIGLVLKSGERERAFGQELSMWIETTSDEQGAFRFPGVPPVDSAELTTSPDNIGTRYAIQPLRNLDLSRDVTDLIVRLDDTPRSRYRVQGVLPDETVVPGRELHVCYKQEDSGWMTSNSSSPQHLQFNGSPGRPIQVLVATTVSTAAGRASYVGETLVQEAELGTHTVRVDLLPAEPKQPRPDLKDTYSCGHNTTGTVLDQDYVVQLVDASNDEGLPPGTLVGFRLAGGYSRSTLDKKGRILLFLPPSTTLLQVEVAGYRKAFFQLPAEPGGFSTLKVALQPE